MNKNNFLISVFHSYQFPIDQMKPHVAFCGRSNAGKSSLINSIYGSSKIAKTSTKPGKTISINFFDYDNKLLFADLPGYGYARVSQQDREEWRLLIDNYLQSQCFIKAVFIICDIRRGISEDEIGFCNWLRSVKKEAFFVFTKIDKLTNNQFNNQKKLLLAQINDLWHDKKPESTFFISSLKKTGIDLVKTFLQGLSS